MVTANVLSAWMCLPHRSFPTCRALTIIVLPALAWGLLEYDAMSCDSYDPRVVRPKVVTTFRTCSLEISHLTSCSII